METSDEQKLLFIIRFLILYLLFFMSNVEALNKKVSAVYVFGDSTVDPGNNNHLKTIFKSNFPPYGRDFARQEPTGRFTNGKLGTDFIAQYMGVKELLPAYLDPKLSNEELITGVSFASGGSGFDPLTPTLSNVISLPKQLEYFKECKKRLEGVLGKDRSEEHIKKAVFFISAGTNDFVINYFTVPIRRKTYTLLSYRQFLIQNVKEFIQNLSAEGARKIAVVGLPPMGCLPIVITLYSNNTFLQSGCIDKFSSVARDQNLMIQHQLQLMQLKLSNRGAKIYYIDSYGPVDNMIQQKEKCGFEDVDVGCCGSGYLETSFLCNRMSYVCPDASKSLFWDSIHPTEKAYHIFFKAALPTLDRIIKD